MASLPNSKIVTYEEWLHMPEQGVLEPKGFPGVQIDIARIWPD